MSRKDKQRYPQCKHFVKVVVKSGVSFVALRTCSIKTLKHVVKTIYRSIMYFKLFFLCYLFLSNVIILYFSVARAPSHSCTRSLYVFLSLLCGASYTLRHAASDCSFWLHYNVQIDWQTPLTSHARPNVTQLIEMRLKLHWGWQFTRKYSPSCCS